MLMAVFAMTTVMIITARMSGGMICHKHRYWSWLCCDTNMCKPAPPSSKDETITNGLSLEGVHVGTVNLMISSGTVILILFAVFFYFYCKGRRGFCGPPATSASSPPAPANGFQHAMVMPGYFPQYPPPRTQCHRPSSQATRWQFLRLIKPLHRLRRLPCPPAQQSFPHRPQVLCPSDNWRLVLTRCTLSRTRHRMWSWPAGATPMKLSIELAMNASFPTLSSETLIGKWFVINICSIFIPSAATHLSNSAFFKAGIFVLQLNLLCCPCFARTPMQ